MNFSVNHQMINNLGMASEDHYRKIADGYRQSQEYKHMRDLYPTLRNSIELCQNEILVN